jgi:hypothetical protein
VHPGQTGIRLLRYSGTTDRRLTCERVAMLRPLCWARSSVDVYADLWRRIFKQTSNTDDCQQIYLS